MTKPYPQEFRDDVVAVARRGQAPLTQIARVFGTSEARVRAGCGSIPSCQGVCLA